MRRRWWRIALFGLTPWLVLWPVWNRRQGWSLTKKVAASAGVGLVWVIFIVAIIAAGAASDKKEGEQPAVAVAPVATPVGASPATTGQTVTARVVRVVDGDTIVVKINGKNYTIRYIGVDTPETVAPRRPIDCYGPEATAKNRELVEGKTVRLEKDVSETDRFRRLLRYVYVNGVMVNAELVGQGYAMVSTFPPDVKYADMFAQLQAGAREANRGLWGACPLTPAPEVAAAGCTSGQVNINTASFDELRRIKHIGEVRAQEVIRLREQRPFRSVDDLIDVRGIGRQRLADIEAEGLACVE